MATADVFPAVDEVVQGEKLARGAGGSRFGAAKERWVERGLWLRKRRRRGVRDLGVRTGRRRRTGYTAEGGDFGLPPR